MPADSMVLAERPIVRCPSGLRGDGVRALHLATNEAGHALHNLSRRARELELEGYACRIEAIEQLVAELGADLRRTAG